MANDLIIPRRTDADRITRAVKKVERLPATLPPRPGATDLFVDSVPIYNSEAFNIPAYSIAYQGPLLSDDITYSITMPPYSCISNFVIITVPLPAESYGRGWTRGIRRVTLLLQPGESVAVGNFIRPHKGVRYARLFDLGPMEVQGILGDATNDGGSDIETDVMARIVGWRGDHIYVRNSDDSVVGPAQVLVHGRGYAVDLDTTPGIPDITKVEE